MVNVFPLHIFDRWFYQSIVSKSNGGNHTPLVAKPQQDGICESLAAVDLNESNGTLKSEAETASNRIPDEAEMRRVFDRFDENNDGVICCNELERFMSNLGFEMSKEEFENMLKTVDKNGDGSVDFEEFYSLYQQMTGSSNHNEGGRDADGEDDEEENLREAFQVFDKNQDGYITAQELQSVLVKMGMAEGSCLGKCQKMIATVDADGNGQVDFEEFKKMMNSNFLQQS